MGAMVPLIIVRIIKKFLKILAKNGIKLLRKADKYNREELTIFTTFKMT